MHVRRCHAGLRRGLLAESRGLALMEFALGLPVVMALGAYGVEVANLAMINMRVSQAALQLADNASRVGTNNGLAIFQLREGDINDVFQGVRLAGNAIQLTTFGRVTLSSLENIQQSYDTNPTQRIHWQRCIGKMSGTEYSSSYGTTAIAAGSTAEAQNAGIAAPDGMGDTGSKVSVPSGSGVMFVEVNYQYRPVFGGLFMSPKRLHYSASFMVRDRREYSQIFNPGSGAVASTCDKFAA